MLVGLKGNGNPKYRRNLKEQYRGMQKQLQFSTTVEKAVEICTVLYEDGKGIDSMKF